MPKYMLSIKVQSKMNTKLSCMLICGHAGLTLLANEHEKHVREDDIKEQKLRTCDDKEQAGCRVQSAEWLSGVEW